VKLVELGIANAAREVTDEDLVGARVGNVNLLDNQRP
jgi:hypothetical protein